MHARVVKLKLQLQYPEASIYLLVTLVKYEFGGRKSVSLGIERFQNKTYSLSNTPPETEKRRIRSCIC